MICSISGRVACAFGADHGHIDRHLPPAIDGIASIDDFRFNDGAAIFLGAQIGTRQENHADSQPVGHRPVAAVGNGIVKEAHRQVDVQSRTIPGLAIGVDRTAMPDSLQRLDPRRNHTPRSFAICGRNQTNAAGIAFGFGMIHAFAGKAFMFGSGEVGHGKACHLKRRNCLDGISGIFGCFGFNR